MPPAAYKERRERRQGEAREAGMLREVSVN
jgi:hypothetical protein